VARLARFAGEGPRDRRRRFSAPAYVDAIDAIRRAIPADGAYLLVNADPRDGPRTDGGWLWVRFELAPRRAVLAPPAGGPLAAADLRWEVVARAGGAPPELYDRSR
jgi:hypothetical protein